MPKIADMLRRPVNADGSEKQFAYSEPLSTLQQAHPASWLQGGAPPQNPTIRCPLPATGTVSPDSLRQYYQSGVPQFRVFTAK